jgi:hypothetical protein
VAVVTITFLESGSDATSGLEFWGGTSGTVASDSAQSKTGPRAIKFTGNSTVTSTLSIATAGRLNAYWRFSALPATPIVIVAINRASTTSNFYIRRRADGTLGAYDPVAALLTGGGGTAVLGNDTWHRVAVSYSITSDTIYTIKVWVNGVLDINISNAGSLNASQPWSFLISSGVDGSNTSWVDDIYLDDITDGTDPGDIRVTAKLPAALNTNNFDTTAGSGAARYNYVDDRAIDTANYLQHAANSDAQENFGIQDAAVGDVDISDQYIVGCTGWVYARRGDPQTVLASLRDQQIGEVATTGAHTTTVIPSTNDMTGSGKTIVVAFACDDNGNPGTTATCADSQGNTYSSANTVQASATGSATGVRTAVFIARNVTNLTGANTITVTHGSVSASAATAIQSSAEVISGTALDVSSTNVQTGTTAPTSNSAGPTTQVDIVWFGAAGCEDNELTTGSPRDLTETAGDSVFTSSGGAAANIGVQLQYQIASASGQSKAAGYTSTNSADWTTVVGAYKVTTGTVSVGDPKLMLNGTETSLTLTTSNALYSSIVTSNQYPSGAAGIGMRSSGTSADTFLVECGVIVAYDASKGPMTHFRASRQHPVIF